jgi:hypothetical protein
MSSALEEGQGHQFLESRAHQRNGQFPTHPPIEFTIPYARQVVSYVPCGGWGYIGFADLRHEHIDYPDNVGWEDGWAYNVDQGLQKGGESGWWMGTEFRGTLGGATNGHQHKLVTRYELSCGDPRNPISGAFYQITRRLHVFSPDNAPGGAGDVEHKIETEAGVLYHRELRDSGVTAVTGDPNHYWSEWLNAWLNQPWPSGVCESIDVDATSGNSVVETNNLQSYWFEPYLHYTLKITSSIMPSDSTMVYADDAMYQAELLTNQVDVRDPERTYNIYDAGEDYPPTVRKMARTEILLAYWRPPSAGAGDPPADGNPLTLIITPASGADAWTWPETPNPYPPWDPSTGEWLDTRLIPPEYQWLPITEDLWFSTYACAGRSLVGLLSGRYVRRLQAADLAHPATTSPDNGYETRKDDGALDSEFSITKPTEKYYGSSAYSAQSIARIGDL